MGDNDFTAGDPWGLPIEDSEDFEIEGAPVEEEAQQAEIDSEDESVAEDPQPDAVADEPVDDLVEGYDDRGDEPLPVEGSGIEETIAETADSAWWSPAGSESEVTEPIAIDSEPVEEEAPAAGDYPADAEEVEESEEEEEYTFTAPTRTPLSQMIAAAQSVVSSVQAGQPEESPEADEAEELEEAELPDAEYEVADAVVHEDSPAATIEEPTEIPTSMSLETPAADEDLPPDLPAWLIVDAAPEDQMTESVQGVTDGFETEDDSGSAREDIEASMVDAAPEDQMTESVQGVTDGFEAEDDSGSAPEDIEASMVDAAPEDQMTESVQGVTDGFEAEDDSGFTPEDIEASIVDLAAPETGESSFAEDHFEMPGATDAVADDEIGDVDMDSSPGVYSELHHLAGEDDQAEALLQEAAVAFGQPEDSVGQFEEDAGEIPEIEVESSEEIDSLAEALATELETEETPSATIDEYLPELPETEEIADTEEIDSFAEALATELETEETPSATIDEYLPELPETEEIADTEEIDSFAEALATELETEGAEEDLVEPGTSAYLSDVELGEALAGLADASIDDLAEETDSIVEGADEALVGDLSDDMTEEPDVEPIAEAVLDSGRWDAEELGDSPVASDEAERPEIPAAGSLETEETLAADEEAATIDSPVAWGTRYREAHQGWIEDDEGRSTWRPIVTSGESVAGWDIDIYLGMVSGDIALDLEEPGSIAGEVAAAREGAGRRMLDEALARGAHAVVGVTFSIQEVAGAVLVAASGVAVTLRTPA